MVGVITSWDVLAHPIATIRSFGWRVFFRAIEPWQAKTFLDLLQEGGCFGTAVSRVPAILDRCIALELRAKRIYSVLGGALADHGEVGVFFATLADQEQYHADLLEVCRAAAGRQGWRANLFNPWQDYLPRLEQQMDDAESAVREIDSVEDALRLVIRIESSEVNEVFHAALAATDAAFVKRLRPFRETMEAHMDYIAERIPQLAPSLVLECREMRVRAARSQVS